MPDNQIDALVSKLRAQVTNSPCRDHLFAHLSELMQSRIHALINRYRLHDLREDAEQAAAIGLLKAIETFDQTKASFVTHAAWQIRGELQSLRHRMRLDQRQSALSA
ncbi:MAG: sigma factor [Pseudomonadota bacterium]|nr:sigma factor [Pseudomonadota bacterium]